MHGKLQLVAYLLSGRPINIQDSVWISTDQSWQHINNFKHVFSNHKQVKWKTKCGRGVIIGGRQKCWAMPSLSLEIWQWMTEKHNWPLLENIIDFYKRYNRPVFENTIDIYEIYS